MVGWWQGGIEKDGDYDVETFRRWWLGLREEWGLTCCLANRQTTQESLQDGAGDRKDQGCDKGQEEVEKR